MSVAAMRRTRPILTSGWIQERGREKICPQSVATCSSFDLITWHTLLAVERGMYVPSKEIARRTWKAFCGRGGKIAPQTAVCYDLSTERTLLSLFGHVLTVEYTVERKS